jgi:hypothetical protein
MFEVIICTVSTGRVKRKSFTGHDEALAYADKWQSKQGGGRYRVEVSRKEPPAPPSAPQGPARAA